METRRSPSRDEGVLGGLAMSLSIHLALIVFALAYPVNKPPVGDELPIYTVTLLDGRMAGGGTPQKTMVMAAAKKPADTVKQAPAVTRASAETDIPRAVETENHLEPEAASAKPDEKTSSDTPVSAQTSGDSAAVSPALAQGLAGGDEPPGSENRDGPAFIVKAIPKYPLRAKRLGKEGTVLLLLTLSEKGRLVNADVVEKAGFGFEEAALSAVRQSVFKPARRDGREVACRVYLPIVFRLSR